MSSEIIAISGLKPDNRVRETKHKNRAQMKSETESRKDDLVRSIRALAKDAQKLARVAV